MAVDVLTEVVIARSVSIVSSYAADPSNASPWYANIPTVRWVTSPPVRAGSRIEFTARFLGRQLTYTYEVVSYVPLRDSEDRVGMVLTRWPVAAAQRVHWQPARRTAAPAGTSCAMSPATAATLGPWYVPMAEGHEPDQHERYGDDGQGS